MNGRTGTCKHEGGRSIYRRTWVAQGRRSRGVGADGPANGIGSAL